MLQQIDLTDTVKIWSKESVKLYPLIENFLQLKFKYLEITTITMLEFKLICFICEFLFLLFLLSIKCLNMPQFSGPSQQPIMGIGPEGDNIHYNFCPPVYLYIRTAIPLYIHPPVSSSLSHRTFFPMWLLPKTKCKRGTTIHYGFHQFAHIVTTKSIGEKAKISFPGAFLAHMYSMKLVNQYCH